MASLHDPRRQLNNSFRLPRLGRVLATPPFAMYFSHLPIAIGVTSAFLSALPLIPHAASDRTIVGSSYHWSSTLIHLTVDGRMRQYRLHARQRERAPKPLLLVFHGLGSTSADMERMTGLNAVADAFGISVAYLDAADGSAGSWALGCARCTAADTMEINDIAFAAAVVHDVTRHVMVDSARVYAVGFSLGAYMVQVLGCRDGERYAAIVAIGGHMLNRIAADCRPRTPPSSLIVSGTADPVMPFGGRSQPGTAIFSADSTARFWAALAGCSRVPVLATLPDVDGNQRLVRITRFDGCRSARRVELYAIDMGEHEWPHEDMDGSRQIVQWLLKKES